MCAIISVLCPSNFLQLCV